MAQRLKPKKDRTSALIALILHAVIILGVGYWAWKTGKLEQMARRALEFVRQERKEAKKDDTQPVQQKQSPPPKLPPINQGLPPPSSSGGTRRAVAADAPEAHGETFFADTRAQTTGPSTGAAGTGGAATNTPPPKAPPPPAPTVRPLFDLAARKNVGTVARLLEERAASTTVQDAFGSEQISRSGTSTAADVVSKITGASVVEGKHAVIRGLSDRYNLTTLNGAEIPSADPYRRSVQIDVFNTDMIEKIVTTKTFSPDLPGSATGGNINIVTKSFPARPFFNFSLGGSFNPNANLNDRFLVAPGRSLDAFGPGTTPSSLPPLLRAYPIDQAYPDVPSFYRAGSAARETPEVAAQRRALAERAAAMMQALGPAGFKASPDTSPLNHNYAASAGTLTHLFFRPLGVFVSASYEKKFSMYEHGVQGRYDRELEPIRIMDDMRAVMETAYGGSVNLAYQLAPEHELSFNFLYNQNLQDEVREQYSTFVDNQKISIPEGQLQLLQNHYIARQLQNYMLRGRHVFESLGDNQLEWLASLSTTAQDEPDYRFYHNVVDVNGRNNFGSSQPQPDTPARYFRELEEQNLNFKVDDTIPFRARQHLPGQLKLGLNHSASERTFFERTYLYRDASPAAVPYAGGDPNGFLTPDDLGFTATRVGTTGIRTNYSFRRYLVSAPAGNNEYLGNMDIQALYLMGDFPLSERVKLIGGVRMETTDLQIDGFNGISNRVYGLQQADLLLALGLVITLRSNMNLRLNWAQTVARPTFREIADYKSWDVTGDELLSGNPNLKMTSIDNYDLRWEWFPRPNEVLSVGLFYKDLKQPIEKFSPEAGTGEFSYQNRDAATLYGVEFEARKNLGFLDAHLANFTVGLNLALIQSETRLTQEERDNDPSASPVRPLYDQSPYIINLDLNYENKSSGTSATLLANLTGERLYAVNLASEDIYEHPPVSLDFVISQRLSRHWKLKFTAKNLLDGPISRTYGKSPNGPVYGSYTRGRQFGLSLSAEF